MTTKARMATEAVVVDTTDDVISALRWIDENTHPGTMVTPGKLATYDDFSRYHLGKNFFLPEGSVRVNCPAVVTSRDSVSISLTQAGYFILSLADKLEKNAEGT